MLANLAARSLDGRLQGLADREGFVYSRYADDLCFSTTADLRRSDAISSVRRRVMKIINAEGFSINDSKTKVAGPGSRKMVLGLLVDGAEPVLSKIMRRRIERHLYIAGKFGIDRAASHEGFRSSSGYYNHLVGLVGYANDADPNRGVRYKLKLGAISAPI